MTLLLAATLPSFRLEQQDVPVVPQPYADLFDGLLMPKAARDADPVPAMLGAGHRLSLVRSPKDKLDALPAARAARDALNHWIMTTEGLAA